MSIARIQAEADRQWAKEQKDEIEWEKRIVKMAFDEDVFGTRARKASKSARKP